MEKVNKAIQFVLATLSNIVQLKLKQEECIRHIVAGKDAMPLLPTGLFTENAISGKLH